MMSHLRAIDGDGVPTQTPNTPDLRVVNTPSSSRLRRMRRGDRIALKGAEHEALEVIDVKSGGRRLLVRDSDGVPFVMNAYRLLDGDPGRNEGGPWTLVAQAASGRKSGGRRFGGSQVHVQQRGNRRAA